MTKKLLIIITAIVALILIGIIYWPNGIDYTRKYHNIKYKLGYTIKPIICKVTGGKMQTTGCGIARCTQGCFYKKSDAGKRCLSSKDCKGKCLLNRSSEIQQGDVASDGSHKNMSACIKGQNDMYDCSKSGLQAACQSTELENCEMAWEYDHGIAKRIMGDCSL